MISGIVLSILMSQGNYKDEIKKRITGLDKNYYSQVLEEDFKKITVDVTAYSPTVRETDSTPFITASNKSVKEGYIAVSRDLEYYLDFGDKVFIEDIGIFEVQDRMNRRWKSRVDIFFYDTKKAVRFGKVKKKMWIIERKSYKDRQAKK
jgi:3D (Asp-Asp-Asp) domain-containing protein